MKLRLICIPKRSNLLIVLFLFPAGPLAAAPHRTAPDADLHLPLSRVEYGTASWYGARAQGRLMACGEPFNEFALTAAHRTLPFGATVAVTNLRNGRSVIVRIKDRGPALTTRIIDLSLAAAARLGFVERGLAQVKVEVLSLPPARPNSSRRSQNVSEARLHSF